jgi:hypothetical protein
LIYLYWYLGIGITVFAFVFGSHWLRQMNGKFPGELLYAPHTARTNFLDRLLNKVVVPVLAAVALMVAWPVAVYLKVKEIYTKTSESAVTRDEPFVVQPRHLQERLTVPQIELREVIADPLGAVPDLPFGYLNPAWRTFLGGLRADDEVWSFRAAWQASGAQEIRVGYAVVRGGVPTSHLLTSRTKIVADSGDR